MKLFSQHMLFLGTCMFSALFTTGYAHGHHSSSSSSSSSDSSESDNQWHFFGPVESIENVNDPSGFFTFSPPQMTGRLTALAIGKKCNDNKCRLWVGAAGGSLWRTDDALNETDPKWTYLGSNFAEAGMGSLALDPNDSSDNTLYVGTGETNSIGTSMKGSGLYKTTDGGAHFKRVSTLFDNGSEVIDFTRTRGIASIVVEPGKSDTIYVATAISGSGMTAVRTGRSEIDGYPQAPVGLYKTTDGGKSWSLIWQPVSFVQPANPNATVGFINTMEGVKKVQLDPTNPSTVYVTAFGNNVYRSAPSLEGGDTTFKPVYILDFGTELTGDDLVQFEVVAAPNGRPRIYVGNGMQDSSAAVRQAKQLIWRFDNADVPASQMASGGVNSSSWVQLTSGSLTDVGASGRNYCGTQCAYNQVLVSPPGRPDTLCIAGTLIGPFFTAAPSSCAYNAGTSHGPSETVFHPIDATGFQPDSPVGHVDVHAITFNPENPDIVFVGSDGGLIRTSGFYHNRSSECVDAPANQQLVCNASASYVPAELFYLNRNLTVSQVFGIGVDFQNPLGRMLLGIQDNGTQRFDGSHGPGVFENVSVGDGTSATAYHPSQENICFASFQSNNFFTSFQNGDPISWAWTSAPITAANETTNTTLISARQFMALDKARPDAQYTGYQHIWRTQNNGGNQAFLEANCLVANGFAPPPACGDWVALGISMDNSVPRMLPGSGPTDPLRNPGNLTSVYYGNDRVNGIITSACRGVYNKDKTWNFDVLWAGTSNGRLFITENCDNVSSSQDGRNVTFTRIDTPQTPGRFVSRIVVDPNDPFHAFISYAGFSAVVPGAHVYDVRYNPSTGTAIFKSIQYDLGDVPVNVIAYDSVKQDLYAGFDTGVKVLKKGKKSWEEAGSGLRTSLVTDLQVVEDHRLLMAGTHSFGVFYLHLDK